MRLRTAAQKVKKIIFLMKKNVSISPKNSREKNKKHELNFLKDAINQIRGYCQKIIAFYKPSFLHESFYTLYSVAPPQGFYTLEEKSIEKNITFCRVYLESLNIEMYTDFLVQLWKDRRKTTSSECEALWYIHGFKIYS